MSNNVGFYTGEWIQIRLREELSLLDILRNDNVISISKVFYLTDIEDSEDLITLSSYWDNNEFVLNIIPANKDAFIFTDIYDFCENPYIEYAPLRLDIKILNILTCIRVHPDFITLQYLSGIAAYYEE